MFDDRITQNSRSVQDNLISRHNHFKCELLLAPLNSQMLCWLPRSVRPSSFSPSSAPWSYLSHPVKCCKQSAAIVRCLHCGVVRRTGSSGFSNVVNKQEKVQNGLINGSKSVKLGKNVLTTSQLPSLDQIPTSHQILS